ncbi:alcohol oxidase [Irpex rosettiformis]|uniref:Alcohol oxidase n=1 Tax=Irpex rosettiformis TaxID=378272 RepID=A0ACB8TXP0_9APHY|nr:alcohol oxidase [Irpex rosettiformis]
MLRVATVAVALSYLLRPAVAQTPQTCASPSISPSAFANTKLDYVIIGGGTAGLAVASRLADDPSVQVGVIEAGLYHPVEPLIDTPSNVGATEGNPNFDWAFLSVPQPGLNGRQMTVPRGKLLGGSSALNFLAWNRGSKPDYDAWSTFADGSSDWGFEALVPYLRDTTTTRQNQTNPYPGIPANETTADFDPNLVGFSGPIASSYNDVYVDPPFPYIETLNSIGIPTNPNPDNGNTAGIINSRASLDRSRGVRSYAVEYYCRSVSQSNFHVLTGAQVTKILFNSSKKGNASLTATGIQYTANSTQFSVNVTKEVVLSAGTIQTPQLLELSGSLFILNSHKTFVIINNTVTGIGNSTLLNSLNVTTLVDLPGVGENLQDHLFAGVEYEVKPGVLTFDWLHNNATFEAQQTELYKANGTGYFAAFDSTLTWLPFELFLNSTQVSSILNVFDSVPVQNGTLQPLQHQLQRQWIQQGNVPQVQIILHNAGEVPPLNSNSSYFTAFIGTLHPWARGSVHINTTNPLAHPVINEHYLENDYDVQTILSGVKLLLSLQNVAPLSNIIQARNAPAVNIQSDADLINYIRSGAASSSHPAGTAALGPRAQGGVVGPDLVVYGTTNLRIADASVMPTIVGANLQQTVYAIGEKAAALISQAK